MVIDSSDDEDLDCAKETAPEIHDIDSGNDIFSCSGYASEIFQNLKQSEVHIFIFYPSVEVEVLYYCLSLLEITVKQRASKNYRTHVIA